MSQSNRSFNGSTSISMSRQSGIFWCTSFGVLGLFTFSSNLATIVTFAINKDLRRHGIYCLINLAVADMLLGAIIIPYYVHDIAELSLQWSILGPQIYIVTRGVYITVLFASLFSLVVVSLNRVYATFWPFKYRTMKIRTHFLTFVLTWLIAIGTALVFFLLKQLQDQVVLVLQGVFALALLVIITSYVFILIEVKVKKKKQNSKPATLAQKRERQLAITISLVALFSVITWVPSMVFHGIYRTQTSGFSLGLQLGIYLIHSTNSLINPVIYAFRMKDFRKALFKLITSCLAAEATVPPASTGNQDSDKKEAEYGQTNRTVVDCENIVLDTKF